MHRQPARPESRHRAPASILIICALIAGCTASPIRTGERETAAAIGESDRFTLKFIKDPNAGPTS